MWTQSYNNWICIYSHRLPFFHYFLFASKSDANFSGCYLLDTQDHIFPLSQQDNPYFIGCDVIRHSIGRLLFYKSKYWDGSCVQLPQLVKKDFQTKQKVFTLCRERWRNFPLLFQFVGKNILSYLNIKIPKKGVNISWSRKKKGVI